MGNSAVKTVNRLRDPYLVLWFQNLCGARVEVVKDDGSQNEDVCRATYRARIDSSPDITPPASPTDSNRVHMFPLPGTVVKTNTFVDIYFRMATEVGYEMFYILALPLIHFNFDAVIMRRMVVLWSLSMYIGQALKSVICIKRPAVPPVLKLENNPVLDQEYGFPSTHAIVSTVMPFYFMISLNKRYQFPLWLGLLFCVLWSLSVSFSRIYLGVHSFLDIIGGYLISAVALWLSVLYMDALDQFLLRSAYAPVLGFCTVALLLCVYPVDDKRWTMDRGDTAAILGAGLGFVIGVNCMGELQDDILPLPIPLHWPSLSQVWLATLRYVCGILLLIPTRFVMKLLCFRLLPAIMPTGGVQEVSKRPWVELPYKIITYSAIGFNCYYTSTFFFRILGINRF